MVLEISRPGAFSYLDPMGHPDNQAEQNAAGAGWALRSRDCSYSRGIRECLVQSLHFSDG